MAVLAALALPDAPPPGLGLDPRAWRAAPFVYPLLQFGLLFARTGFSDLRSARRALRLAAWAYPVAQAVLLVGLFSPPAGAGAGFGLFARSFFLLLALFLPAFGWVLATDPPPPNRRFGAVSRRGLRDPAFWERSNRVTGRLMLALGPLLALAAFRLPFLANLALFLLALGAVSAVPALLERWPYAR